MSWSDKYKRSIDCDNPRGFSQKAHCKGKKKKLSEQLKSFKTVEKIAKKHRLEVSFIQKQLDMGEPIEHEHTKDHKLAMEIALQHLDEIPDYYTRLKKMEASAKKEHKKFKDVKEENKSGDEGLHDWFGKSKSSSGKKGWVQLGGKFAGEPCARQPGQTSTPKCGSSKMKRVLSKDEEEAARRRKNRLDPNQPEKSGGAKPTNVRTEEMNLREVKDKPGKGSGKKDACYTKVKSRYDVWPSAYASGALVKCRKVGAANWGTKSESTNSLSYDWDTPIRERAERYCPKCDKLERRSECKYGEKYWDMFSIPSEIINSKKDFNVTKPHPGNFPESYDHEYSMARSELSTIISAAKRLRKKMKKGEGNIEAWVQSKITKAADYIDAAADYVDSGEMQSENVSIEDANGRKYVQFIDIIKPQPLKPSIGIGSRLVGEGLSFEIGAKKTTGMGGMTPQDIDRLKQGNPGAAEKIDQKYQQIRRGINLPLASKKSKKETQVSHYEPDLKSFQQFMEDWQSVNRKDKTDGLSQKAVDAYRSENPGSKLQTAVTEKKPTGNRAKRRANYCRRSKGQQDMHNIDCSKTPDKPICKARRRWKC